MVKVYALATVVAMFSLSMSEVDWLVKNKHAEFANRNGNTALKMDAEQVEIIISEQRDYNRYRR